MVDLPWQPKFLRQRAHSAMAPSVWIPDLALEELKNPKPAMVEGILGE